MNLEARVAGKICGQCGALPQVAWYEQQWRIRCDCGYGKAELVTPKYARTAIDTMQEQRRQAKRRRKR